jgi:proline iminopeptidase
MKAQLRGTEIYFDIGGMQIAPTKKGFIERPVVFMLHGGPGGDHTRYKQFSAELQESAQLVYIDHRGCGRSKKTSLKDYTLENNIEDIEALRKHLGLEKICLLGTSYGGMVAQGYAIRYPKRVEKLILLVTAPSYRFIDDAKKYITTHGSKEQIAICEHLWAGTFKNHAHIMKFFALTDTIYSVKARHSRKKPYRASQAAFSHDALNEGFSTFLRTFDFTSKLKKIACPTLVLGGADDWICNSKHSKIIAEHIPNATLKIFKNCGHAIAIDVHDQCMATIQKFLQS